MDWLSASSSRPWQSRQSWAARTAIPWVPGSGMRQAYATCGFEWILHYIVHVYDVVLALRVHLASHNGMRRPKCWHAPQSLCACFKNCVLCTVAKKTIKDLDPRTNGMNRYSTCMRQSSHLPINYFTWWALVNVTTIGCQLSGRAQYGWGILNLFEWILSLIDRKVVVA